MLRSTKSAECTTVRNKKAFFLPSAASRSLDHHFWQEQKAFDVRCSQPLLLDDDDENGRFFLLLVPLPPLVREVYFEMICSERARANINDLLTESPQ